MEFARLHCVRAKEKASYDPPVQTPRVQSFLSCRFASMHLNGANSHRICAVLALVWGDPITYNDFGK
jgi:hypothetical protein